MVKITYVIAHILDLKDSPKLGIRDRPITSSKFLIWLSGVLVIGMLLSSFLVIGVSIFGHRNQVM